MKYLRHRFLGVLLSVLGLFVVTFFAEASEAKVLLIAFYAFIGVLAVASYFDIREAVLLKRYPYRWMHLILICAIDFGSVPAIWAFSDFSDMSFADWFSSYTGVINLLLLVIPWGFSCLVLLDAIHRKVFLPEAFARVPAQYLYLLDDLEPEDADRISALITHELQEIKHKKQSQ